MERYTEDGNFIIEKQKDFILSQTLECGQCFHFVKLDEEDYLTSAKSRILHIAQKENRTIFYNTDEQTFDKVWKHYFDLERDYGKIKSILIEKDDRLTTAIEAMSGVRILNQEFFETLISFIISQNQQIVRIKQIVAAISSHYGRKGEGIDYFPGATEILAAGEQGMKDCKAGFRAKYIIDACEKYVAGELDEKKLLAADYNEAVEILKSVKGIGNKVANCIALFSLDKRNAFPVDVWIKRIMEAMYFHKETPVTEIEKFGKEKYGELSGYAQQYLFYYGKTLNIGK